MDYIQGKLPGPSDNGSLAPKNKHKKGNLKVNKFIANGLQDSLVAYVGNLRKSKDIYDKIVNLYEVNKLNEIISLKGQLKDMKMNKGEFVQSYIMRISHLRDQLQRVEETLVDKNW